MDVVLDLESDPDMMLDGSNDSNGEGFVVQLLRSITIDSAVMNETRKHCCHRKYGRLIDNSILRQYINLIRNAVSFIYIENQYFLGSAYSWLEDDDTLSHHIIPMELTQKIISKIQAGESFHVYICIPMYPEVNGNMQYSLVVTEIIENYLFRETQPPSQVKKFYAGSSAQ